MYIFILHLNMDINGKKIGTIIENRKESHATEKKRGKNRFVRNIDATLNTLYALLKEEPHAEYRMIDVSPDIELVQKHFEADRKFITEQCEIYKNNPNEKTEKILTHNLGILRARIHRFVLRFAGEREFAFMRKNPHTAEEVILLKAGKILNELSLLVNHTLNETAKLVDKPIGKLSYQVSRQSIKKSQTESTIYIQIPGVSPASFGVMSDIHLRNKATKHDTWKQFLDKMIAKKVDAIIIPGDILEKGNLEDLPSFLKYLNREWIPPVIFSPGNHEYNTRIDGTPDNVGETALQLIWTGAIVLNNDHFYVNWIRIEGVDDLRFGTPQYKDDLDTFKIISSHNAKFFKNNVPKNALLLSWHTHNGQNKIPILTTIANKFLLENDFHMYGDINYPEQNSLLYISSGVGYSGLPMRKWVDSELVVIHINK